MGRRDDWKDDWNFWGRKGCCCCNVLDGNGFWFPESDWDMSLLSFLPCILSTEFSLDGPLAFCLLTRLLGGEFCPE